MFREWEMETANEKKISRKLLAEKKKGRSNRRQAKRNLNVALTGWQKKKKSISTSVNKGPKVNDKQNNDWMSQR